MVTIGLAIYIISTIGAILYIRYDSDKKCAENFGIDYIDVKDFLEL